MDISGLIQSYDSRVASSAPPNRTIMAPQYIPNTQYTSASMVNSVAAHQNVQHNPFSYNPYTGGSINVLVPLPTYASNYIQQRSILRPTQPGNEGSHGIPYARNSRQGFVEELHGQSPVIKAEPQWNSPIGSPPFPNNTTVVAQRSPTNGSSEITFGTEVDTLMKAIQAKSQGLPSQKSLSIDPSRSVVVASRAPPYTHAAPPKVVQPRTQESRPKPSREGLQAGTSRSKDDKKRYVCSTPNCSKSFYQKTHLDIHERCHTGDKPYPCRHIGCDRTFSQLGNLKTHERRHTGERPYQCETCGKRFAQRGNVRAHRIVHDQAKPYLCRLDDCGKQFTQLGNLKSHQNKFHAPTIRDLTNKFASIKHGDIFSAADKDLWEYFANLYKNSNKGIKGRGKDRKVGLNTAHLSSGMRSLGVNVKGGYPMAGAGRGNMVVGVMDGNHGLKIENQYEMFDADDESQSGSNSSRGSTISAASCYGDTTPDRFEGTGRAGELAFGDRIY